MKLLEIKIQRKGYIYAGLSGLFLIWVTNLMSLNQAVNQLMPPLLWQVLTGTVLLGVLLFQWALFFARVMSNAAVVKKHYTLHKVTGLAALVLFALHATRFGYAWTLTLFIVFIALTVTGLLSREFVRFNKSWLNKVGLWLHISLAALMLPLTLIHIMVALTFE